LICLTYFGLALLADSRSNWPEVARESKLLPVVERATRAGCGLAPERIRELCARVVPADSREEVLRQLERLNAPTVRVGPQEPRPGYSEQERRELDRLFRTTP
jgi:hypothetical protein